MGNVEVRHTAIQFKVIRIGWRVGRSKGNGSLTVIFSSRERVTRLELQSVCQTTISLQDQCVVGRIYIPANLCDVEEVGIQSSTVNGYRHRLSSKLTTSYRERR